MKVSIILPVYNVKDYFEQCIQSLVQQTYKDIEIILVDDGSTDGSNLLCDKWAEYDNRILVFHKENGGTHTARNLGLQIASGQYVMFIDPDDWIELNTVEYLVEQIKKFDLDVARFNYIREYKNNSLKKENSLLEEKIYNGEECLIVCRQTIGLLNGELQHPENLNFLASACFSIYRKSILDEYNITFYNIKKIGSFEDGLFNIHVFNHMQRFGFFNQYFYHYRKTNLHSNTTSYKKDYFEKQMVLFEEIENFLKKNHYSYDFQTAYQNRIVLCTMELCLNEYKSGKKFFEKYNKVKCILKDKKRVQAYRQFSLKRLPLKWKVYHFFMKYRWVFATCIMTNLITSLKGGLNK
ncbi:MAG: glycosyltransferase [Clostridia bacterium]|nr:glycosyltransferase [Clostridia bacterium]